MATRDYKKLYNDLKTISEATTERYTQQVVAYTELKDKYVHLDKEFTKAVNANKNQQVMFFEQRGIIGFLENKIEKLQEQLRDE
jgi:hypothetical protein